MSRIRLGQQKIERCNFYLIYSIIVNNKLYIFVHKKEEKERIDDFRSFNLFVQ